MSKNSNSSENLSCNAHYIRKVCNKSFKLNKRIHRAERKYLRKIESDEKKLQKKLCRVNTGLADYFFKYSFSTNLKMRNLANDYASKNNILKRTAKVREIASRENNSVEYFPMLDSLETVIKFYEQLNEKDPDKKITIQLAEAIEQITDAKKSLNQINGLQKYLRKRKIQLGAALKKYPELSDELKSYDKSTYYFKEQINEYKNIFKEPSKIEEKVLKEIKSNYDYGTFFSKNNLLAKIFSNPYQQKGIDFLKTNLETAKLKDAIPDIKQTEELMQQNGMTLGENAVKAIDLKEGIPDIKQTEDLMQQSVKAMGDNPNKLIEANMSDMHSKMNKLKTEFSGLSNAGDIPDFKPNPLKTKRFSDRMEYGLNFQFAQGTLFVPVSGEIGISVGYKITTTFNVGLTSFYRAGFGDGLRKFEWKSNGWSYGAYAEQQLKGIISAYVTYERDFYPNVSYRNEVLNKSVWKNSALIGLKLKIKTKKKYGYSMTLLYDFINEQKIPFTPALVYRFGWQF